MNIMVSLVWMLSSMNQDLCSPQMSRTRLRCAPVRHTAEPEEVPAERAAPAVVVASGARVPANPSA